jgi:hypothetical protein
MTQHPLGYNVLLDNYLVAAAIQPGQALHVASWHVVSQSCSMCNIAYCGQVFKLSSSCVLVVDMFVTRC